MIYERDGKKYKVDSVTSGGVCINVNGTTITDQEAMSETLGFSFPVEGFSVFVDGDELYFNTFEEAYDFATTKQKNTMRI